MAFGLDIVSGLIVSAFTVTIGYLVNGSLQRSLKRRTTNYKVKLEAFQRTNEAVLGLIGGLIYLRMITSTFKEGPLEDEDVLEIVMQLGPAREVERPLGTSVVEKMVEDLKAADELEGTSREDRLRQYAEGAQFSLLILYMRVLAFHTDKLTLHASQAEIVAEYDNLEASLAAFQGLAMSYLEYILDKTGGKMPSPELLDAEIERLNGQWKVLKQAMWEELKGTLPARLWPR